MSSRKDAAYEDNGMWGKVEKAHYICLPEIYFWNFWNVFVKTFPTSTVLYSLRKTVGKVSQILVTLRSRSNTDFKYSNASLKENKPDGVDPNSNDIDYYVRKNEGKILWFSAECINKKTVILGRFWQF